MKSMGIYTILSILSFFPYAICGAKIRLILKGVSLSLNYLWLHNFYATDILYMHSWVRKNTSFLRCNVLYAYTFWILNDSFFVTRVFNTVIIVISKFSVCLDLIIIFNNSIIVKGFFLYDVIYGFSSTFLLFSTKKNPTSCFLIIKGAKMQLS